jgi:hypothetical protein
MIFEWVLHYGRPIARALDRVSSQADDGRNFFAGGSSEPDEQVAIMVVKSRITIGVSDWPYCLLRRCLAAVRVTDEIEPKDPPREEKRATSEASE